MKELDYTITIGRDAITGGLGKCLSLYLGTVVLEEKSYEIRVTLGKDGLQEALKLLENADDPVDGIQPNLVYQWVAFYDEDDYIQQFEASKSGIKETLYKDVRLKDVKYFILTPIDVESDLPAFSFNLITGDFMRDTEILEETRPMPPDGELFYARKVTIVGSSDRIPDSHDRTIHANSTSVLQLLGWKAGSSCFIIAIEETGAWRVYKDE